MSEQKEKIDKLKKIADSGDEEAQFVYGLLRLKGGNGVVKNEEKAREYLFKSADSKGRDRESGCDALGYPLACYHIGLYYSKKYSSGDQITWEFFENAARKGGIVDAMVWLARIGKEAGFSYEKQFGQYMKSDLSISCAWAYLAQARAARARDRAEADKLVQHFEQEEPSTAKNPDRLRESQNKADEWDQDRSIGCEAKPPSIDEIIEKHEKAERETKDEK